MLKFMVLTKSRIMVGIERVAMAPYSVPDISMGKVSEPAMTKDTQAYTVGMKSIVLVRIPT